MERLGLLDARKGKGKSERGLSLFLTTESSPYLYERRPKLSEEKLSTPKPAKTKRSYRKGDQKRKEVSNEEKTNKRIYEGPKDHGRDSPETFRSSIALRRRLRCRRRATTEDWGLGGMSPKGRKERNERGGQGSRLRGERSAMQADLHPPGANPYLPTGYMVSTWWVLKQNTQHGPTGSMLITF